MSTLGCCVTDLPFHWCPRCGTFVSCEGDVAVPAMTQQRFKRPDPVDITGGVSSEEHIAAIRGCAEYSPIVVAIALSLYAYNVSAQERAEKLYRHFDGNCLEMDDMNRLLVDASACAATGLPYPTAKVYVQHALERYGEEAAKRALCEETAFATRSEKCWGNYHEPVSTRRFHAAQRDESDVEDRCRRVER